MAAASALAAATASRARAALALAAASLSHACRPSSDERAAACSSSLALPFSRSTDARAFSFNSLMRSAASAAS